MVSGDTVIGPHVKCHMVYRCPVVGCVCVAREPLPRRADGLWRSCLVFGVARVGVDEDLGVRPAVKQGYVSRGRGSPADEARTLKENARGMHRLQVQ